MAWRLTAFLKARKVGWALPLWAALCPAKALSYPTPVDFDGSLLRWDITAQSEPISYEIVSDSDSVTRDLADLVATSAAMWSNIPTSYLRLQPVQTGALAQITIHLDQALDGAEFSAGYATFDGRDDDGGPTHCSIHVDLAPGPSRQALAKTILHELGHCVGLGHSLIPEAIMSYSLTKNQYQLDVDDVAAVSRLYPANGEPPELPAGCSIGLKGRLAADAARRRTAAQGVWWLLVVGVLPLSFAAFSPFFARKKTAR